MMAWGLLWYDDNPTRDLPRKVALACARYRRKFGAMPDACYVHPSALGGGKELQVGVICVKALGTVLRNHFWVGREDCIWAE